MVTDSAVSFQWQIMLNPTIAGTWNYTPIPNASLEVAVATDNTNTINPLTGIVLTAGVFSERSDTTISAFDFGTFPFGVLINGTVNEIIMVVRPLDGTNKKVQGTVTWNESW
jgi:hypothetical protein